MPAESIDFDKEVNQLVNDRLVGRDDGIAIWGGEFHATRVSEFLKQWDFSMMPYRIWEYVHRIEFACNKLPDAAEAALLDRGRIFGHGGDLSLRRDGDEFLWHFIGSTSMAEPESFDVCDFWTESPGIKARADFSLRQRDESALLWGAYHKDLARWQEDRVGRADLSYPFQAVQGGQRVWIHYSVFTDGGQVAFVWWKELKDHG